MHSCIYHYWRLTATNTELVLLVTSRPRPSGLAYPHDILFMLQYLIFSSLETEDLEIWPALQLKARIAQVFPSRFPFSSLNIPLLKKP